MSLSCNICILSANYLNPLHNKLPNRYRSHKASYSNLIPKIDSHGNDLYNLKIAPSHGGLHHHLRLDSAGRPESSTQTASR